MPEISLNYNNLLEIDITPQAGSPTWAQICKGFANLAESLNEVLYQASFLCDAGWGSTEVTGGQYICTLTGVRYFNNAAQDYIFSDAVMHAWGEARKTTLRLTRPNGEIILWPVTLANITISGGDANQPSAISVAIHGNGAPTIQTDTYLDPLVVVSLAVGTEGETSLFVNPPIGASHSYKYQLGSVPVIPAKDEVLTTGWTAWDGNDSILAIQGQIVTVAEVITATNAAQKAGSARVYVVEGGGGN